MRPSSNLAEVETRIHTIRGISVLLDSDLAGLYGVTPSALLQAVRRNQDRRQTVFAIRIY